MGNNKQDAPLVPQSIGGNAFHSFPPRTYSWSWVMLEPPVVLHPLVVALPV